MKPKQVKKLKQELGREVNKIKADNREKIDKASPFYEYTLDKDACWKDTEGLLKDGIFASGSRRALQISDAHKQYIKALEDYIYQDYLNKKEVPYQSENYTNAFLGLYYNIQAFLSAKGMLVAANSIVKLGLLSKLSTSRLLHYIYYNNDWEGDEGYEIANLCFADIDRQCALTLIELENEKIETIKSRTISEQIKYIDSKTLKEKLASDEPFSIYRGFGVDEDEYVRKGLKTDGDDYYRYAGKGVSYSLDKNVAIFFANRFLDMEGKEYHYITLLETYAPTLVSKEDYIKAMNKSNKKPVVAEFIINPKDIRGAHAGRREREINIFPEDLIVKRYQLLSPEQICEGLADFRYEVAEDFYDYEGIYDPDKVVVLTNAKWVKDEKDKSIIFANGNDVNKAVKEFKESVKYISYAEGIQEQQKFADLSSKLFFDLTKRFGKYSLEIPDRYLPLNTRNTSLLVRLIKKGVQFARKPFTTYK